MIGEKYLLLVIVSAALLFGGCSSERHEAAKTAAAPPTVKGALVEVVRTVDLPEEVTAVGTVRAGTSALVASRLTGTVTVLSAREGDRVAKGAELLTIQAQEAASGALGAAAGADEAQRGLDDARARLKLADATLTRFRNLLKEQAVTRQEFETREMEQEVAMQGVARAEARLAQAKEAGKAASAVAGYARVTAPLAGVIVQKQVDLGSSVFPGSPLVTIEAEGSYRLELAVPESLSGRVKPGQIISVSFDAAGGKQQAKVIDIVPLVDPATRTFTVKVALPAKGFRSGMYGQGIFTVGSSKGIVLPTTAVVTKGALTGVWVVDQAGLSRFRLIRTGRLAGEKVEIVSGLASGERVVVGGVLPAVEGSRVE